MNRILKALLIDLIGYDKLHNKGMDWLMMVSIHTK